MIDRLIDGLINGWLDWSTDVLIALFLLIDVLIDELIDVQVARVIYLNGMSLSIKYSHFTIQIDCFAMESEVSLVTYQNP